MRTKVSNFIPPSGEPDEKIPRLSEIDLARIGPLVREGKLQRLRELKQAASSHLQSCSRFRRRYSQLATGDVRIGRRIYALGADFRGNWQTRTSENERKFNLAVAAALYDFGVKRRVLSYDKSIAPWSVGYGQSVAYWWNLYTVIERRPSFIFVDPRIRHLSPARGASLFSR